MTEKIIRWTLRHPPFYPWCRTTTVPFFDDEFTKDEKRAARDEDGEIYYVLSDMTYKEWKQQVIDDESWTEAWGTYHTGNEELPDYIVKYIEKATAKPVAKSAGSGIRMASKANGIKWPDKGTKVSNKAYKEIMEYARSKGIELSGFKQYDGEVQVIKELVFCIDYI